MTSYTTIELGHRAHIDAWDGHIVCSYGDCTNDADLSRIARDGSQPTSPGTRTYEPYKERVLKSPKEVYQPTYREGLRSNNVQMTPYYHESIITRNFLLRVPQAEGGLYRKCSKRERRSVYPFPTGSSNEFCGGRLLQEDMSFWTEVYDYDAFRERAGNPVTRTSLNTSNILTLVAETRSDAVSKSFRDYDALTDLLQIKQSAKEFSGAMGSVLSLYRKFINGQSDHDLNIGARMLPRDLVKSATRSLRKLGSLWLAYRYSVMPIMYSVKDIFKLMNAYALTTDKSTKRINTPTTSSTGSPPSYQILVDETGEVRITSTVVCKYATAKMAQAGRTSINPFNTAWEFVPYSFIADWFVNIGDTINILTSADLAESVGCCTAIRTSKIKTYTGIVTRNTTVYPTSVDYPWDSYCWPAGGPTATGYPLVGVSGVLRTEETQSYTRVLFKRLGAVQLIINPNLSWRRYLDSAALSTNQLKTMMSRIRTGK